MADIALVSLGLESSGVTAGERTATRSLQNVEKQMQTTERQFEKSNQKISTEAKKTGEAMAHIAQGSSQAGNALNQLGGPVGTISAQLGPLGNAIDELQAFIGRLGLVGGIAAGAVSGIAALAASFISLTLDGVKVSDELGDIAESTNLSLDSVQRLAAAMTLSGESISGVEKAFKTYTAAVVDAQTAGSPAAKAFQTLGINAVEAGQDIEKSFLDSIVRLKEFRATIQGADATNLLFSKGVGALVRTSDNLTLALKGEREELERTGVIATLAAVEAGGKLDAQLNKLSNSTTVFKQNLAASFSGKVLASALEDLTKRLSAGGGLVDGFIRLAGAISLSNAQMLIFQGMVKDAAEKETKLKSLFNLGFGQVTENRSGEIPGVPRVTGTGKAAPARPVTPVVTEADLSKANASAKAFFDTQVSLANTLYSVQLENYQQFSDRMIEADRGFREAQIQNAKNTESQLTEQLSRLKPGTENFKRISEELDKVKGSLVQLGKELNITVLPEIEKFINSLKGGLKLSVSAPPPITTPPEFSRPRTIGPHPDDVRLEEQAKRARIFAESLESRPRRVRERTAEQEALDQQFAFIFDDFLGSILTARKTLGGAFADFALGIVDSFAFEFTKTLRDAFVTPVIKGLTDALQEGLNSLFSGLSAGGLKGIFGGIVKGIGTIFGGFFAGGGTLGPNKFGVAGERGPELIFSGSHPLHVSPVTAGTTGNTFNITVPINAPQGAVDRRTQDQVAVTVLQAVRRAQRNEGAR